MEPDQMIIMWGAIAVAFVVLEITTMAFVALYVAAGSLVALLVAVAGGALPMQIVAFSIAGVALLALTRPIIMRRLQKDEIPTNVHWLVGKRGIVTIEIDADAGTGQIRVGTEHWTAAPESGSGVIAVDDKVDVARVEGVTAMVRPLTEPSQPE